MGKPLKESEFDGLALGVGKVGKVERDGAGLGDGGSFFDRRMGPRFPVMMVFFELGHHGGSPVFAEAIEAQAPAHHHHPRKRSRALGIITRGVFPDADKGILEHLFGLVPIVEHFVGERKKLPVGAAV